MRDTVRQLLQQGCITRRGRSVLTDADTCIEARTSSVELAASAGGRECQQSLKANGQVLLQLLLLMLATMMRMETET